MPFILAKTVTFVSSLPVTYLTSLYTLTARGRPMVAPTDSTDTFFDFAAGPEANRMNPQDGTHKGRPYGAEHALAHRTGAAAPLALLQ